MGYLILIGLAMVAVNALRHKLSLDWEQFTAMAVGLPVAALLIRTALRLNRPSRKANTPAPGAALFLRYRDVGGRRSERTVEPRRLMGQQEDGPDGKVVSQVRLLAHCRSRGGVRTFRLDRIETAALADTGEVIDDIHAYFGLPRRPGAARLAPGLDQAGLDGTADHATTRSTVPGKINNPPEA